MSTHFLTELELLVILSPVSMTLRRLVVKRAVSEAVDPMVGGLAEIQGKAP